MNLLYFSETFNKDDFQSRNTLHIVNGMMKSLIKQKEKNPPENIHHTCFLSLLLWESFGWLQFTFSSCPARDSRFVDELIRQTGMLLSFLSFFSATSSKAGVTLSSIVLAVALMINPFAQVPCVSNPSPQDLFNHTCLSLQYFAEPKALTLKSIMFFHIIVII